MEDKLVSLGRSHEQKKSFQCRSYVLEIAMASEMIQRGIIELWAQRCGVACRPLQWIIIRLVNKLFYSREKSIKEIYQARR